jgi:hypothetical protein
MVLAIEPMVNAGGPRQRVPFGTREGSRLVSSRKLSEHVALSITLAQEYFGCSPFSPLQMQAQVSPRAAGPLRERNHLMNRKIKALGLALVAALALTLVMASAAQAQFTSSASHTTYSGTQSSFHKFTAGAGIGEIRCGLTASGTGAGTSAHNLTISLTYNGCGDSLGRAVDVVKNTLSYTFTSGVTLGETKGLVDVNGELTTTVTTAFGHCTITIKGTQAYNGVSYVNYGGTLGFEAVTNSNNVHSVISGGGFACGTSATTSSSGTYVGRTTFKGKDSSLFPASISVD